MTQKQKPRMQVILLIRLNKVCIITQNNIYIYIIIIIIMQTLFNLINGIIYIYILFFVIYGMS